MSDRFRAPALPGKMKDPLAQRIPSNPKYKDVRPTVDTGASVTKYWERIREIKADYKYKQGEIFKRVKVTSLVGLMIKIAEITEEEQKKNDDDSVFNDPSGTIVPPASTQAAASSGSAESTQASRPSSSHSSILPFSSETHSSSSSHAGFLAPPAKSTRSSRSKRSEPLILGSPLPFFPHPSSLRRSADSTAFSSSSTSSRPTMTAASRSTSSLQGLIGGIGERTTSLESVEEDKENAATSSSLDPPYLLMDIREEDAFNSGHLRTAMNFPSSRLSRAFQFETKELRSFRNAEGKIIIVYDEDETMAPRAATILVQRGYDNVYLLSGGINVAEKFFPGGLLLKSDNSKDPPTTPELKPEEISKLQSQLEAGKKASSPCHRPTISTTADRRRTQMIGGQFKQKKTLPKPIW